MPPAEVKDNQPAKSGFHPLRRVAYYKGLIWNTLTLQSLRNFLLSFFVIESCFLILFFGHLKSSAVLITTAISTLTLIMFVHYGFIAIPEELAMEHAKRLDDDIKFFITHTPSGIDSHLRQCRENAFKLCITLPILVFLIVCAFVYPNLLVYILTHILFALPYLRIRFSPKKETEDEKTASPTDPAPSSTSTEQNQ